jgi:hypothetical protein
MKQIIMKRVSIIPIILIIAIVASFVIINTGEKKVRAATIGPGDIYAAGGTPCVAAYSTVRAMYGSYSGKLYQIRRASDNATKDISVLEAGGFADSSVQDSFSAGSRCTISIIYDQSGHGNHLTVAPAGGAGKADVEAIASSERLQVGGNWVYSVFTSAGMGYRNNKTNGVATGDQPESMYMVTSGKHFNGACCYDFGNAETNNLDNGNGCMEAIYFGNCTWWGKGSGNGPWVMADLENGLFGGQSLAANPNNTPITSTYVTAMVKGKPGGFCIKGGDANSGNLKTMYEGARPTAPGYNPMHKEGAIILGIGGDNSNGSAGTFYEGAITTGYASDATDNAIQENIIAAGYGKSGSPGGQTTSISTTSVPTEIKPTSTKTNNVVTFYRDYNYSGSSVSLEEGRYTMAQLASAGISNDSISSIKVPNGLQVEVYSNDNFSGNKWTFTSDTPNFGSIGCNDVMSSVIIKH